MSRLLFAAARGARIQRYMPDMIWCVTNNMPVTTARTNYRIHPDDAHLQYGPVSAALRERAALADRDDLPLVELEAGCFLCYDSHYFQYLECNDRTTRQTYVLLMAEALADEGL